MWAADCSSDASTWTEIHLVSFPLAYETAETQGKHIIFLKTEGLKTKNLKL